MMGGVQMKVRVPIVIKDPVTTKDFHIKPTEGLDIESEDFFLDGPVTKRVAILDFDPATGALLPGARFKAPQRGRKLGSYEIADEDNVHAPNFNQVSVFGTVLKTMSMFEEEDTLGRPLTWAFNAPQLLVVPRAGEWANAFYERESHSLQFFYFHPAAHPSQTVHTSLSHDIVAHETGHAILDGIIPDLYHAISPQSLALHEAIADLTALVMAFRCRTLCQMVLNQTGGSIEHSEAFSGIAEEFGMARDPRGRPIFLRNLLNQKTLNPHDTSRDEYGRPNLVARNEPHDLSEVLSGALYTVMVKIHEALLDEYTQKTGRPRLEVSGKALFVGRERFKRIIFRALDYLPPGEVSFADYGRAIIAADQASHPDDVQEREWIREEFIRRGMVPNAEALRVETNFEYPALKGMELETLVNSDWAAYEFANQHRKFLGIPAGIHFWVRPRLDTTKLYYDRGGQRRIRECLFKVSWDHKEPNHLGSFYPLERQITVGTTLAIDWETKTVRALVTSDFSHRPQANGKRQQAERDRQRADRNLMLDRLADRGLLQLGNRALGPDGELLRSAIKAETMDGLMRVRGAARMLHITAGE
jgi:hypothetical protein